MVGKKFDIGKTRMELLPFDALEEVAKILSFGAIKYGPNSWQNLPDAEDRYMGALLRHISAHKQGEVYDPESGISHLAHAACNALFLLHFQIKGGKDGRLAGEGD